MMKKDYVNPVLAIMVAIVGVYLIVTTYPKWSLLGILFLVGGAFTFIMDTRRNRERI
ncbi:hypothetical protein [Salimicrobium flavidum]|uniref:Uncharacterized protein n=1 Tax=Salimicrobium flavidum TaxID=570947 RepID=A0A1N7K8E1_9BACI|nr:hypothetical protein [Salimicrobium flavidum]SIS57803.1 hypothetical protein SAMN05421687_10999 [Salimicrobium flavidum]